MQRSAFTISNLRDQSDFVDVVTERIWTAWWRDQGHPLDFIARRVDEILKANDMPLTLIAHDGARFLGTASIIENDMEARPHYTPWVAAVWVEPEWRKAGIGSALVSAATEAAFTLGTQHLYLCANENRTAFYQRLGWQRHEDNVSGLNVLKKTSA